MYEIPRKRYLEENEITPAKLDVNFKDFGPIAEGNISLKPLTIFLGSNNSGKSYAAMLIHSIFESYIKSSSMIDIPVRIQRNRTSKSVSTSIRKKSFNEIKKFADELIKLEHDQELEVPALIISDVTNKIIEEIYENQLSSEIIRSFSAPLNSLNRIGKKSFSINLSFDDTNVHLINQNDILKISNDIESKTKINFKVSEKLDRRMPIRIRRTDKNVIIGKNFFKDEELLAFRLTDIIFDICTNDIFYNNAKVCYYLPAARSGILQGHKALMANIVEKIPFVGIEKIDFPKFSGVVSDFLSSIIKLPDEKGKLYDLSQEFEHKLIEGNIIIKTLDQYSYSEIMYNFQDTEIPLHRASSTVSELAPLFLYLKYLIKPGNILIIEEPEAHLHPKNQRILSRLLVKLIRNNVNVLITTHSEYLLEQLNIFMGLSKIDANKRIEIFGYDEDDILNPKEVSAYIFNRDTISGGSKVDAIEITDNAISQEEFIKVHEILYEETIKLDEYN